MNVAVALLALVLTVVLAYVLYRLKQPAQVEGRTDGVAPGDDTASDRFYRTADRPAGPDAEDAAPSGEPDGPAEPPG
jgi:hypothetical protein